MKRVVSILLSVLLAVHPALAAVKCVRSGATGTGSGDDWTNAYTSLPSTLTRGNTYYIADGTYGGYVFNDAESGTTVITIKKATAADHGTETGWSSAYGDGQAVFTGELEMVNNYYVIDGVTRNENNWQDDTAYGFRVQQRISGHQINNTKISTNVVVQYCNIGGTQSETFDEGHPDSGIYLLGGSGYYAKDWTISKCYVHNVDILFQLAGVNGATIEYCWIGPGWQKETIRGQLTCKNVTIRYNIMKHGCQNVVGDPPDGRVACTGQIAIWDDYGVGGNPFDNNAIYSNLIIAKTGVNHSDSAIVVGGNGSGFVGPGADNTYVANNTIIDITVGNPDIELNGANTSAYNNLGYNLNGTWTFIGVDNSGNNGEETSSSVFVDYAGFDLRLSAAIAGTSLGSPYNTDLLGNTRGADGVFDRGAYEFQAGGGGGSGGGLKSPLQPGGLIIRRR